MSVVNLKPPNAKLFATSVITAPVFTYSVPTIVHTLTPTASGVFPLGSNK